MNNYRFIIDIQYLDNEIESFELSTNYDKLTQSYDYLLGYLSELQKERQIKEIKITLK